MNDNNDFRVCMAKPNCWATFAIGDPDSKNFESASRVSEEPPLISRKW